MTIVVDASVAVRWLFPVAQTLSADELVYERPVIAPDLVIAEITNAAWKFVAYDNVSSEVATAILREAEKGYDELVPSVLLKDRALEIAISLRHPAYDCFYLALAEERDCPMVTADDRLLARCAKTPFAKRLRPLVTAPSNRRR